MLAVFFSLLLGGERVTEEREEGGAAEYMKGCIDN